MENRQEILKALQTIQNVCKANRNCDTCPLAKDTWCVIQDQDPESWKIRSTDTWKAFED